MLLQLRLIVCKAEIRIQLFPANGPRYWTVGENMGEMLVAAFDDTEICAVTGRQVVPTYDADTGTASGRENEIIVAQ
jgi:hypothetical protein